MKLLYTVLLNCILATVATAQCDPPVAKGKDVTLSLDEDQTVRISARLVDAGSYAPCGLKYITVIPTLFSCDNLGENEVLLTVIDVNGNSSYDTITVNLLDKNRYCEGEPERKAYTSTKKQQTDSKDLKEENQRRRPPTIGGKSNNPSYEIITPDKNYQPGQRLSSRQVRSRSGLSYRASCDPFIASTSSWTTWVPTSTITPTSGSDLYDDGSMGPIPFSFSFEFCGNTYSELYINANGTISFGG
ncbi:MAG: hypothetical protein AAFP02_15905, partial [Bacteroidota bacterium]